MTVGFHSPLPPSHTGVADYSAALLSELRRHGQVVISPERSDIALYHIGNNRLHQAVYAHAVSRPGIVVLHDALLHHFYLGSFQQKNYAHEFVFNYGSWASEEADLLWQERALSGQDPRYFLRPMLKRITGSALAVIVHNPAAARAVREHSPETPVAEIAHHFQAFPPPSTDAIARFRRRIGVPPNGFVFAIFGYLRESKRLLPALKVFARVHRQNPKTHLLVVGQFVSQDLERVALPLLAEPGVHRIGHLSEEDFRVAAAAVDCCLNLRYPAAGETSGIAIRLMGAAKPVVVTEGEEWASFPQSCFLPIPAGPAEAAALFEAMSVLSDNPEMGRQMGLQAAEHIQRYHSLIASGTEYWNFLCRIFDSHS